MVQGQGPALSHRAWCPCCGKRFTNVLRHLNHRESKCASWFDDISSSSPCGPLCGPFPQLHDNNNNGTLDLDTDCTEPMPQDPDDPPTSPQHNRFPGAGAMYGRATSFLERLDADKYARFRTHNAYYPFAGKGEWDLGSFLHSSGLSMQKIDEFLALKMVIIPPF